MLSASIVVMTAILVILGWSTPQIDPIQSAYADTFDTEVKPTLFWHLKIIAEDIQELVTFDNEKKKKLIAEHALERQKEINDCIEKFDTCPREFEIRRLQKIEKAESIEGGGNAVLDSIEEIKRIGEYNEIRIAVSEFHQARGTTDPVQRELLLDSINDRVNSLKTVKQGCTRQIDSRQIISADNYYEEVQKICPKLKTMPIAKAYEKLYEN